MWARRGSVLPGSRERKKAKNTGPKLLSTSAQTEISAQGKREREREARDRTVRRFRHKFKSNSEIGHFEDLP